MEIRWLHPGFICPAPADIAIDLIEKLLEIDPMKRASAADALEHPYFQDHNL